MRVSPSPVLVWMRKQAKSRSWSTTTDVRHCISFQTLRTTLLVVIIYTTCCCVISPTVRILQVVRLSSSRRLASTMRRTFFLWQSKSWYVFGNGKNEEHRSPMMKVVISCGVSWDERTRVGRSIPTSSSSPTWWILNCMFSVATELLDSLRNKTKKS